MKENDKNMVKILMVDDRPENLFALEVMLSNEKYTCVKVESGLEAIAILQNEQNFALILMDVQMPDLDGFETVDLIRKIETLKHIPIIFLTASMDNHLSIFKGYQAGAFDYMIKPLSPEILIAKVSVFVDLCNKTNELLIAQEAKRKAENATLIAEDAVKAKQQFLSNMSHEIRTPMNAIIGFTKVLLKTNLTKKQKEFLTAIKLSGDTLIVLINDILDLAKVDAGKMVFEKIPFRMEFSISTMLQVFEIKIQEKNLALVTNYDSNIPAVLVGDQVRLHQIILNLVSNAVKFTSTGKITVNIKLLKENKEDVIIEFSVSDTGIGIQEDKINGIFNNFQQATSDTSRLYGGTGLGLAIVKQLVEGQGGTIKVASMENEGSTFSISMPFLKTNDIPENVVAEVLMDTEIEDLKVLVVEDIPLNQLLMQTLLQDFGFESTVADNGKIAIEKLQSDTYDIILMDIQMPVMNGIDATEYIRKTLKLNIPIIALTADVTTIDLEKCKSAGINDYIAKPVDDKLLLSKILMHVKKPRTHKSTSTVITQSIVNKKLKCINLDYLTQRTKSNPYLMLQIITLYLEQTPSLVQTLKQGLKNKDWTLLKASAHKMIPSFSIVGIDSEYENMARQIQDKVISQNNLDAITEMVLKIEAICDQACEELQELFPALQAK